MIGTLPLPFGKEVAGKPHRTPPRHLALGGSKEIKPACITGSSDDFDFLLVIRRSGTTTPLGHDPNTTVPRLSNHRKMDDEPREAG